MKFSIIFFGLIPGIGQAHCGHPVRGFWFFALFVSFLNAAIMLPFWLPEASLTPYLKIASWLLTLVIWVYSLRDYIRLTRERPAPNDEETSSEASSGSDDEDN